MVKEFIEIVMPVNIWDLGANIGLFSRIVSNKSIQTISLDSDPTASERNYLKLKKEMTNTCFP